MLNRMVDRQSSLTQLNASSQQQNMYVHVPIFSYLIRFNKQGINTTKLTKGNKGYGSFFG